VLQARPPDGVGPPDRERVQGIRDSLQMRLGEVEIQHRMPDLHVTEQELNRPKVRATFK
jgi:hypothetical protein